MREIKFRGKTLNGEWVYGYYVEEDGKHGILADTSKIDGIARVLWTEVDPETVGQFTGLKDRNCKEIYERDVWEKDAKRWIVAWIDKYSRFVPKDKYGFIASWHKEMAAKGKIIGNIYDNPDLLT